MGLTVIRGRRVVDKSQNLHTLEHELFRHIEVEIFVLRQHLPSALKFVPQLLQFSDGNREAIENETWTELTRHGLDTSVRDCAAYTHHYPICVRKLLADETLISMASSQDQAYYAIRFISYIGPSERDSFFAFVDLLVETTTLLFNASPHWGKYSPIDAAASEKLYPQLSKFRLVCEQLDSPHVFRNAWADLVIGNEQERTRIPQGQSV